MVGRRRFLPLHLKGCAVLLPVRPCGAPVAAMAAAPMPAPAQGPPLPPRRKPWEDAGDAAPLRGDAAPPMAFGAPRWAPARGAAERGEARPVRGGARARSARLAARARARRAACVRAPRGARLCGGGVAQGASDARMRACGSRHVRARTHTGGWAVSGRAAHMHMARPGRAHSRAAREARARARQRAPRS